MYGLMYVCTYIVAYPAKDYSPRIELQNETTLDEYPRV
jgi:hypothetical protein